MKKYYITFIAICLIAMNIQAQRSCSIIVSRAKGSVLVASNLDTQKPTASMWYKPTTDTTYGRICFGIDENFRIAENGFNEHGLFIDLNSVDSTGWTPDPEKPNWEEWEGWFGTGVPDGILAKCKNVEEAIDVFKKHNLFMFNTIKYVLADSDGKLAILEWSNNEMKIIRPITANYVSTNFVVSNFENPLDSKCYRYKIASQMLDESKKVIDKSFLRSILSTVSFEFNTPTQYSLICDLKTLDLSVFFYHNFEEELNLKLKDEIQKGERQYTLDNLFENKSYSYILYNNYYLSTTK